MDGGYVTCSGKVEMWGNTHMSTEDEVETLALSCSLAEWDKLILNNFSNHFVQDVLLC